MGGGEQPERILAEGGETGALMRTINWSHTPLGPIETWPESLRLALSICLGSHFPMVVWWGPDLIQLYNDAYRPILGTTKHPSALGRCAKETWPEIWTVIGPMVDQVMSQGKAIRGDDLRLILDRNGYPEECFFSFSYSPIRDSRGDVVGMFTAAYETTGIVIVRRRLESLRDLAVSVREADSPRNVCERAANSLSGNPHDLPFLAFYLLNENGSEPCFNASTGIPENHLAFSVDTDSNTDTKSRWRFQTVFENSESVLIPNASELFPDLPAGPWDMPAKCAYVFPVGRQGNVRPKGVAVAGLNPHRKFDADFRDFLGLISDQVDSAIATTCAYEEERRRVKALAEIDRLKTEFFSNVSHEFRTPLALMLGPLEENLNDRESPPAGRQRERQELAYRNAQRLLKLVNTILDFSRLESGKVNACFEPTDLAAFTADLASLFRSSAENAGMLLMIDTMPMSEPVYVDREMWEKIVLNLISNALKFTFDGGISVTLAAHGKHAVLTIRDSGVGIPKDELPNIFKRFHRIKATRSRSLEGSGIGLALVQDLAALHGGEASVTSEEGKGSTFTVKIPLGCAHLPKERLRPASQRSLAKAASPYLEEAKRWLSNSPAPQSDPDPKAQKGLNSGDNPSPRATRMDPCILIADDNADLREYLKGLLEPEYVVTVATDGEDALRAIKSHQPDLVISDVMMPRLDGFGLLHALRMGEETRDIPVILLSARAGEETALDGFSAGADDYLTKPFSARELTARVRTHLELARLRRAVEKSRRERAEERADSQERWLNMALASGRMGVWDSDLILGTTTRSNEHDRIFGHSEPVQEWNLESFMGHVVPEDRPAVRERLDEAFRTGHIALECRILRKDGAIRWISSEGRVYHDANGRPVRAMGTVVDITEKHRVDEERQKFVSLVANNADFIAVASLQGQVNYVNPAGRALVGLGNSDPAPMTELLDLLTPEFRTVFEQVALSSLAETGRWEGEVQMRHFGSGAPIDVRTTLFHVRRSQDEDPFCMAFLAHDITVQKRTEESLRNAEDQLRQSQRMESIGKLAGGIAHDFNNLLTAINGYSDIGLNQVEAGTPVHASLMEISKAGERASGLTQQLLAFSRKQQLTFRDIQLNSVVNSMDNLLKRLIPENIRLESNLSEDLGWVKADPGQLEQVIMNLVVNARDAMPEGGEITIRTRNAEVPEEGIPAFPDLAPGSYVQMEVGDTGTGMEPEILARIFEPFFTTKELGKGSGMGLSMVYGIVTQTGGRISAESRPGQGSRFKLLLPRAKPGLPPKEIPARISRMTWEGNETILVVEDETSVRGLVRQILEASGYNVIEAADGKNALEISKRHQGPIQLALTDVVMPRMSGLQLAEKLLQDNPCLGILFMSGYTADANIQRGLDKASTDFLQKPFQPQALIKAVRNLLDLTLKVA